MAEHLVGWLTPGSDQVALYAFHQYLDELQPLMAAPGRVLQQFNRMKGYGKTKLYDAIAEAGRALAAQAGPRRALVVLTDGADNASTLTPGEVSGLASSIDVPVYVIVVTSPLDHIEQEVTRQRECRGAHRRPPRRLGALDRRRHLRRDDAGGVERRGAADHHRAAPSISDRVRTQPPTRLAPDRSPRPRQRAHRARAERLHRAELPRSTVGFYEEASHA